MSPENIAQDDFLALVTAIQNRDDRLSPLTAVLIAAVYSDIAGDSRAFSRLFGIEHALVLRELNLAGGQDCLIEIDRRDTRTQRIYFKLTVKGEMLMASLLDLPPEMTK